WVCPGGRSGRLELLALALHISRFDVPNQSTRRRVLSLYLIVRRDGHRAASDQPSDIATLVPVRLTEKLRVVLNQPLRVLAPDQESVQVHVAPPSDFSPCKAIRT